MHATQTTEHNNRRIRRNRSDLKGTLPRRQHLGLRGQILVTGMDTAHPIRPQGNPTPVADLHIEPNHRGKQTTLGGGATCPGAVKNLTLRPFHYYSLSPHWIQRRLLSPVRSCSAFRPVALRNFEPPGAARTARSRCGGARMAGDGAVGSTRLDRLFSLLEGAVGRRCQHKSRLTRGRLV